MKNYYLKEAIKEALREGGSLNEGVPIVDKKTGIRAVDAKLLPCKDARQTVAQIKQLCSKYGYLDRCDIVSYKILGNRVSDIKTISQAVEQLLSDAEYDSKGNYRICFLLADSNSGTNYQKFALYTIYSAWGNPAADVKIREATEGKVDISQILDYFYRCGEDKMNPRLRQTIKIS